MAGSFALVLADRMKAKKDWVKGRSRCDHCKQVLQPIDLVPLFSWIVFRGRCRKCRVKISVAYPLTELLTGVWFATSFMFWPHDLTSAISVSQFVIWLFALTIMTSLLIYDLRWFLLPFKLINPLIVLAIGYALLELLITDESVSNQLVQLALAFLATYGLFKIMHSVSKGEWIGGGDVRLSIAMALFTGTLAAAWLNVFAASMLGLVFSAPLLLHGKPNKKRRGLKVPFGPTLILGLHIAVVFGDRISEWFQRVLILS